MAEYIEREALIACIEERQDKYSDSELSFNDMSRGEYNGLELAKERISSAPAADVAPVVNGRWEWFEEWSPSTPEHPRECDDCGWRCGECKTALTDMVGGYWDDPYDKPPLNYCPNCGARMDGE